MSTALVEAWLVIVMALSVVAIGLAAVLTHSGEFWQRQDKIFRIGFILLCLGLGVQTYRSVYFLKFGSYPIDHYFPTWIVKDVGFCMIVYSKFSEFLKGRA